MSRDAAEKLIAHAMSVDARVFTLAGVRDKKSLFKAIREVVPLDPPMGGDRDNWDALEDSLWSGLYLVAQPNIVIAWPDASEMLHASPKDFEIATSILEDLTRTLSDPKMTNGPAKRVAVVLGGTWT